MVLIAFLKGTSTWTNTRVGALMTVTQSFAVFSGLAAS